MPWMRLACVGLNCAHSKPVAVASFVIRYGSNTSSNVIRRRARCTVCGHLGCATMHPGVSGDLLSPFPVDDG
jgi:hypothetical protein